MKESEKKMKTYYYADCDEFDNARTGWFLTEDEAIAAFWEENVYTKSEAARINVYTVEIKDPTYEEWQEQREHCEAEGMQCITRREDYPK